VQKLSYQKKKNTHFEYREEERIDTFAPRLTPREKIELKVIHILTKKTLHVSSKQNGARL